MRVVVIGATGNVGTSVLESLEAEPRVQEIVAVARRAPDRAFARTSFQAADIAVSDLVPLRRGADAIVHLAWLIQPGRTESITHRVNVAGSERVFRAAVEAKVPTLVYASSVGAYSPGPKDWLVDESWPTEGIRSSFYSRHKVAVERLLDQLEREQPEMRIVRMRPGLIFKAQAATEIRRLFAGPFLPRAVLCPGLVPRVPHLPYRAPPAVRGTGPAAGAIAPRADPARPRRSAPSFPSGSLTRRRRCIPAGAPIRRARRDQSHRGSADRSRRTRAGSQ